MSKDHPSERFAGMGGYLRGKNKANFVVLNCLLEKKAVFFLKVVESPRRMNFLVR